MEAKKREQSTVNELYQFICKSENINQIPIRFSKAGKGGAFISYNGNRCFSITIDLNNICCGAAYVLCHEIAHQIEITQNRNAAHNSTFKKRFYDLRKKYENCTIASKLIF
jgi:hypothetical protein